MDVIIREMKTNDIKDVLKIESESFSTPWSENAFLIELNENKLARYIVAEIDKEVVGYAGIWFILNEGHITNIAVLKEYRGKGLGNKLIEGLIWISIKNNIDNMTLEVRKTNIVAQSLYKKYGFIDSGTRPGYYQDNKEDAIIMWKNNREGDRFVDIGNRNIVR